MTSQAAAGVPARRSGRRPLISRLPRGQRDLGRTTGNLGVAASLSAPLPQAAWLRRPHVVCRRERTWRRHAAATNGRRHVRRRLRLDAEGGACSRGGRLSGHGVRRNELRRVGRAPFVVRHRPLARRSECGRVEVDDLGRGRAARRARMGSRITHGHTPAPDPGRRSRAPGGADALARQHRAPTRQLHRPRVSVRPR